jgi:hypothetical protein
VPTVWLGLLNYMKEAGCGCRHCNAGVIGGSSDKRITSKTCYNKVTREHGVARAKIDRPAQPTR